MIDMRFLDSTDPERRLPLMLTEFCHLRRPGGGRRGTPSHDGMPYLTNQTPSSRSRWTRGEDARWTRFETRGGSRSRRAARPRSPRRGSARIRDSRPERSGSQRRHGDRDMDVNREDEAASP